MMPTSAASAIQDTASGVCIEMGERIEVIPNESAAIKAAQARGGRVLSSDRIVHYGVADAMRDLIVDGTMVAVVFKTGSHVVRKAAALIRDVRDFAKVVRQKDEKDSKEESESDKTAKTAIKKKKAKSAKTSKKAVAKKSVKKKAPKMKNRTAKS